MEAGVSPRPGNWILERSLDGVDWAPWQFFAISDEECWHAFGVEPRQGKPSYRYDDEVICTSYYSKLDPLENGEVCKHWDIRWCLFALQQIVDFIEILKNGKSVKTQYSNVKIARLGLFWMTRIPSELFGIVGKNVNKSMSTGSCKIVKLFVIWGTQKNRKFRMNSTNILHNIKKNVMRKQFHVIQYLLILGISKFWQKCSWRHLSFKKYGKCKIICE